MAQHQSYFSKLMIVFLLAASLKSCKTKSPNDNISEEKTETILVDLTEKASPEQLILDFSEMNLQKIKVISRPLNIFLFSFDSEKVELDDLLQEIKKSSLVENAQSNKNTSTRQ